MIISQPTATTLQIVLIVGEDRRFIFPSGSVFHYLSLL